MSSRKCEVKSTLSTACHTKTCGSISKTPSTGVWTKETAVTVMAAVAPQPAIALLTLSCPLGLALSVFGTTWPPIDRYKAIIEAFQAESDAAQEGVAIQEEIDIAQHKLGFGLTPQERAVADKAAAIAKMEQESDEAVSTAQHLADALAAAPSSDEVAPESEHLPTMSDDDTPSSPNAKRFKPYESPSKPRSPQALKEALEEAKGETVTMMDIDTTLKDNDMLPSAPVSEAAAPADSNIIQVEVQLAKAAISKAAKDGGAAAGLQMKKEEVARVEKLQPPAFKDVDSDSFTPYVPPDILNAQVNESRPGPKSQPAMSKEEMQMLYTQVRHVKLKWKPDEDGHYRVLEMQDDKPAKLDATVAKGAGKSCQGALGSKHPLGVLRLCYTGHDDQVYYVEDVEPMILRTPLVFHNKHMNQLVSMQSLSRDFVPSKKAFSVNTYIDSKMVKFAAPRNRAPFEWLSIDTKATLTVTVPVRMWDCDYLIDVLGPLDGQYPKQFVEYVADRDNQLMELQNRLIASGDNFSFLQEANMLQPTPCAAFARWNEHNKETLEEVVTRQAALDILNEEERPHMKGRKKEQIVSKVIFDEILRALPPKRKLVVNMGSILFGRTIELPLVPPTLQCDDKPPPKEPEKRAQGRQPGPMSQVPVTSTNRKTRAQAAPKVTPPPPPVPPPLPTPRVPKGGFKKQTTKNTPANGAAGAVAGGAPLPWNSHPVPDHLAHLVGDSPGGRSRSSDSSLQSAAITELGNKLETKLGSMLDSKFQNMTLPELEKLRSENAKLLAELYEVKLQLASSSATVKALETAKSEQQQMHQQWTTMCNSMLGTIERRG